MCDTFIALSNATADGSVIFGKNSDREPNEAQHLLWIPEETHPAGSQVECTYLSIPQASHTHTALLSKPFWTWGAEMGANEHGVVIGNEAVFTRMRRETKPALTGLDLVRLGLERAASAREAVDVVVHLIETYGQGGNCGFSHPFYYDNSFLIGDRKEAWVLETAGKEWAALQVKDFYSISNAITIQQDWDLCSANLVTHAVSMGWCRKPGDFDFARCYSNPLVTRFSAATHRRQLSTKQVLATGRQMHLQGAMNLLRDHGDGSRKDLKPVWRPDKALLGSQVCMHLGFGPVRINQTVGSMVSHLTLAGDTHWATATAAPCSGLFKPLWIDYPLPDHGPVPQGVYDDKSLFWQHERLHRGILQDFHVRLDSYRQERDELEARFRRDAAQIADESPETRREYSQACFQEARSALNRWEGRARKIPPNQRNAIYYKAAWNRVNQQAHMPEPVPERFDEVGCDAIMD